MLQAAENFSLSLRWDNLLAATHEKGLRFRKKKESAFMKKSLFKLNLQKWVNDLCCEVDWTASHIVWAFNLPTAYNVSGQEHIEFEESKKKIFINTKNIDVNSLSQKELEDVLNGWMFHIKKQLKELQEKQMDEFTPIAENRLWFLREMHLYSILEELKTDFVQSVLDTLEARLSPVTKTWRAFIENLELNFKLAKENSDYLSTITYYIEKTRSYNNFNYMTQILSDLMVGLNHIWTMSCYYCLDENMQVLLNQISHVFTKKMKRILDLNDILKNTARCVHEIANNCASFLFSWKNLYMLTRARLEDSGVGSRWEFDSKTLFNEVDHICRIGQDIAYISKVFVQFENLFGDQLKSMLMDPSIVDIMMEKVNCLLGEMLRVDYDVFRPANWENWEDTLDIFNRKLKNMEADAKVAIDQCVTSLKSSHMGLTLITNIHEFNTRDKLTAYISEKEESILRFFVTEITAVLIEFKERQQKEDTTGKASTTKYFINNVDTFTEQ